MDIIAVIIALIVPIGVAVWTVRSSAKDAAHQIAALKDSTTKQVESIKELAKIQIEITKLQMDKELYEARIRQYQLRKKHGDALEREYYGYQLGESWKKIQEDKDKLNELDYENDYYTKLTEMFEYWNSKINALEEK